MTLGVSAATRWIANIVAVAVTLASLLAAPSGSAAQSTGSPLIKIPPAQLPTAGTPAPTAPMPTSSAPVAAAFPPAPRELLPTNVQILRDPRGTGLAMYGTLNGKAASAIGVILAIFTHSEAFDPTPSSQLVVADDTDRHAQALFTATVQGAPVTGVAAAALSDTSGDVTVFYDDTGTFEASFLRMRQALAQSGVATAVLSVMHLADGKEISIPSGWRVTAQGTDAVDLRGPQGELVSLGATMPVYSGDAEAGDASLHAPCCDPQKAFEALFPQINAAGQHAGSPPQEITGVVAAQPVPGNAKGALILSNLRIGTSDYAYLALAEAVAGFTEPWTFTISGVMAPQSIFAMELPTLLQIWRSYRTAEPAFQDGLEQALRNMSATQEMLKTTMSRRETSEFNADAGWDKVIAAVANAKGGQAPIDGALAQSLVDGLSSGADRPWRIVPPERLK
jgi:hypothetical protein